MNFMNNLFDINPLKNISDDQLINSIHKNSYEGLPNGKKFSGISGAKEAGLAEIIRRLNVSIKDLNKSSSRYSKVIIFLTIILLFFTIWIVILTSKLQ